MRFHERTYDERVFKQTARRQPRRALLFLLGGTMNSRYGALVRRCRVYDELFARAVERRRNAEWQRCIPLRVADGEPRQDRYTERTETFSHELEQLIRRPFTRQIAHADPRHGVEFLRHE